GSIEMNDELNTPGHADKEKESLEKSRATTRVAAIDGGESQTQLQAVCAAGMANSGAGDSVRWRHPRGCDLFASAGRDGWSNPEPDHQRSAASRKIAADGSLLAGMG